MQTRNIFSLSGLSFSSKEEIFESLCEQGDLKIERIISSGQVSAAGQWYDQQKHEWVVLLQGKATLEFEDGRLVHFQAGDALLIPAGLRHRVAYTSKEPVCIWIGVHFK